MNSQSLQHRPKIFAEKIAQGHSSTEAYYLAGYKPAKRETAHRAASRLYKNPAVRAYIQELRRTGDELAREETTLTIARKLAFLTRLVLTSSAALREDDPLIQSHRILKDGSTSIRIPCKLKALKMHSELAGHVLPKATPPPDPIDPLLELIAQIRQGIPESFSPDLNSQPTVVPTETPARHIVSPLECDGIASTPQPPSTPTPHHAPSPQDDHPLTTPKGRTEAAPAEIERPLERPEGRTSGSSTSLSHRVGIPPLRDPATAGRARAATPIVAPVLQEHERATVFPPAGNTGLCPRPLAPTPEKNQQPLQTSTITKPESRPRETKQPTPTQNTPASPPVCKLTTETLQTSPSPTQLRKMMIAELHRTSPISHLYVGLEPPNAR